MTRQVLWVTVLVSLFGAAGAQAPNQAAPPEEQFVWITPVRADSGNKVSLRIRCNDVWTAGKPVPIVCEFHSQHLIDDVVVKCEIKDAAGQVVFQGKKSVVSDKDGGTCNWDWDASAIAPGAYTATAQMWRPPSFVLTQRDYRVRKASPVQLRKDFEEVQKRAKDASDHLQSLVDKGVRPPYACMRMAIANNSMKPLRAAFDKADWPRVDSLLDYIRATVDAVPAQLAFGNGQPEFWEAIPQPSMREVEIAGASFRAQGRPVFLFGLHFAELPSADDIRALRAYGLNLAAIPIGPQVTLADATHEADFRRMLDPIFQQAEASNIGLWVSLAPQSLPPWALQQWAALADNGTGQADITPPEGRRLVERHIQALAPYVAGQTMTQGIALMETPEFRFTGEEIRQGFLDVVKAHYDNDRIAVNRAWKGLFADLNEIQIGWSRVNPRYQESPAYRYDWRTYHQQLGAEYLNWMRGLVRPLAPKTPITVAFTDKVFEVEESERGVNWEAIAPLVDIGACEAANTIVDRYFDMGYPQEVLLYTLVRSVVSGKPLINVADRILDEAINDVACGFDYVHAVMWEAAMAGLSASALQCKPELLRPDCLEAYATACLDLNRLAPIVAAFQDAPAEVGILWSMPSKIYADGVPHLASVKDAFEGCSFAGYKVRFITEKQCVDGGLKDLKVLVTPDTPSVADETFPVLKEFMQGQGVAIRTSSSILFDEHGHSRRDIISFSRRTILVRGQNLPAEYLHAMDAVATLGELPNIPRTTNQFEYPLEGVKSRYLEWDGHAYLYVVNLRKNPLLCYLHGGSRSGHDLIRGRDVSFPAKLNSLEPMLVRLDP